ncbi:hypothetical protein GDO81_002790 [Engystomops pustulosus]|uniref:Uncharacterized protein n=1 Tax=Engystomops pustulosus TaxID=76066 RepID=A0AAV7DMW9_ENGPU|nr:hypothetical protein GDO81_002790 [Engystomops pustulosus]
MRRHFSSDTPRASVTNHPPSPGSRLRPPLSTFPPLEAAILVRSHTHTQTMRPTGFTCDVTRTRPTGGVFIEGGAGRGAVVTSSCRPEIILKF